MLKSGDLAKQIESALNNTVIPAIKACKLAEQPGTSDAGNELAENFSKQFQELVSKNLSELIAQAIDYYVKNAQIYGTLITNGSPTTHVCSISSQSVPIANGKIPNTLGIK